MNNLIKIRTMLLLGLLIIGAACSDDDDPVNEKISLTIQAVIPSGGASVENYDSFEVLLTSERDGTKRKEKLNPDGSVVFLIDRGSYGIEVNGTVDGKEYHGTLGVAQYKDTETIRVEVKHIVAQYKGAMQGLVIKEIFYNGGTYNGKMQHPDQYIIIANNSNERIYVDGMVIAQTSNMNSMPSNVLTALLPDFVVVANMYQFPGNGKTYSLKPGEVYIVARSAINHSELHTDKKDKDTGIPVDLSGADFELADEDAYGPVTDNPEVPNLIKISNNMPKWVTGWMHPYGIRPIFLFDGSQIDWTEFKEQNKVTYKEKPNIKSPIAEYNGYKIPAKLIVDAIETTSQVTPFWGNYTSKSLPENVDKSYIQATFEGCHHNTFLYRLSEGNKLKDTNDSSKDAKIEHRNNFKGFPKGWRSQKAN